MSRTQGRWSADNTAGYIDGYIDISARDFLVYSGTGTNTRNTAGDYSINVGNSQTMVIAAPLSHLLYRLGYIEHFNNLFGSASGANYSGSPATTNNPAQTPAGVAGTPPFTGVTQFIPQTTKIPKGIMFLDVTLRYLVGTVALTLHHIGLSKTVYANNVANAVTDIIANGTNGLATANQTNPYVTKVAVAAQNQLFQVSDNSEYWIEVDATTDTTGTYRLYGASLHVAFNFN